MPQLRNGSPTSDIRLDRIAWFDERSRDYPIRNCFGAAQQSPITKLWTAPSRTVLDQGSEGACVGFGVTNELKFNPVPVPRLTATFARQKIYWEAQRNDPWPGGSYPDASPAYEGTAVLAGVKAAAALGYYGEYRWAFGEADLALAVSFQGPAILGLPWWSDMFEPDTNGFLRPTGSLAGGHCIVCVGINVEAGYYTLYNSWGQTWGRRGTAKVARDDMAKLLADDGEACIPVTRTLPTR